MAWRIYGEWMLDEISDKLHDLAGINGDDQLISQEQQNRIDRQFVEQSTGGQRNALQENASQEPAERYQRRREQVRQAQRRHRQHKAQHMKQLELDVSRLREMIDNGKNDIRNIQQQNFLLREALISSGGQLPQFRFNKHEGSSSKQVPTSDRHDVTPEVAASGELKEVSLEFDTNIASPRFHVKMETVAADCPATDAQTGLQLSGAQENAIINFILSLEGVCWGHFQKGDFHHHDKPDTRARGHMLMASAFCMQAAPDTIYNDRLAFYNPLRQASPLTWRAHGPTLQGLYDLASSLNPGDLEMTPIQAWVELAQRYSLETLLEPGTLDSLAREFKGTLRCVIYGASVETSVFESITGRVLGPPQLPHDGSKQATSQDVSAPLPP